MQEYWLRLWQCLGPVSYTHLDVYKRQVLTYEEMLSREDIDIVYIPVPHTAHMELAIKAMEAGKSVLVEKPAGINVHQWEKMTECAKKNQVFLMEAVWTRFFPLIKEIEAHLKDIGDVRVVSTNFSFRNEDMTSRLMDPNRAGGSLLDVGVYDLHFTKTVSYTHLDVYKRQDQHSSVKGRFRKFYYLC